MFPIGFSGKPGAKHRSAARMLKEALGQAGYKVTWSSLTAPLARDTNRLIHFVRDRDSGLRIERDVVTSLSEQEQFSFTEAAQLQIAGLQDLGEPHPEKGYPLDNPHVMEFAQTVRSSRVARDKGFYLRQTLSAADLSADFMIVPDVRSPHEATWFADNGIVLRFLPVTDDASSTQSLDELDDFREFYGRFRVNDFPVTPFIEELESIMEVQFAYAS